MVGRDCKTARARRRFRSKPTRCAEHDGRGRRLHAGVEPEDYEERSIPFRVALNGTGAALSVGEEGLDFARPPERVSIRPCGPTQPAKLRTWPRSSRLPGGYRIGSVTGTGHVGSGQNRALRDFWRSPLSDSNRRPPLYKSGALAN